MSREAEVLKALLDVSKLISSNYPMQRVIKRISSSLRKLLKTDDCSIMILDESSRELAFCASTGLTKWERENIRFRLGEGVAGWVAKNKKPVLISDVSKDPRFKKVKYQRRQLGSMICAPLMIKRKVIGVISLSTKSAAHRFKEEELELTVLMSAHISLALENNRLYEISVLDGLTGLYNRRYLEKRLAKEVSYSRRYSKTLTLLMLDIDYFKKLNDTYGHQAGDHALKTVSAQLHDSLREYDIVARYGGEEFSVILPTTSKSKGAMIADRLRENIQNQKIRHRDKDLPVTVSVGLASFPEEADGIETLMARADKSLYRAKESGRNRIAIWGEF